MLSASTCSGFEFQDQKTQVTESVVCLEAVWQNPTEQRPDRKDIQHSTKDKYDVAGIIRQRHNSSHKDHRIEFDLNSLPIEEFQAVIEEELSLKEKGGRNSILAGTSLSNDDTVLNNGQPQMELHDNGPICDAVCHSPSNSDLSTLSHSHMSDTSSKVEVYTKECKIVVPNQQISVEGGQDWKYSSKAPSAAAEQYRVNTSVVPNRSQEYQVHTSNSSEKFTSRF